MWKPISTNSIIPKRRSNPGHYDSNKKWPEIVEEANLPGPVLKYLRPRPRSSKESAVIQDNHLVQIKKKRRAGFNNGKAMKKYRRPQNVKDIKATSKPYLLNTANLSYSHTPSSGTEFLPVTQDGAQGQSVPLIDREDSDDLIIGSDTEDQAENITEHRPPASQLQSTIHGKHHSLLPLGALFQQPRRHQTLVEGYESCNEASHTAEPQIYSNLTNQHVKYLDQLHEQTYLSAQSGYSQQNARMQDMLWGSIGTHGISVTSAQNYFNLPNLSNQVPESSQKQLLPSYQYPQGAQQIPRKGRGIFNETNGINQEASTQGIVESRPPTMPNTSNLVRPFLLSGLKSYSLRDPRIQARLREKLNAQQHVLPAVGPQNIAVATSNTMGHSAMQPTCFSNRSFEVQIPTVHENNATQILRLQKAMADQSIETNSIRNRSGFEDQVNVVIVMDQPCQRVEFLMDGLSIDQDNMSSDHDTAPDHEMDLEEEPVGTINGNGAAQQVSADQQVEPSICANQGRINDFSTLFQQLTAEISQSDKLLNDLQNMIVASGGIFQKILNIM